jgi:hypothetical protein
MRPVVRAEIIARTGRCARRLQQADRVDRVAAHLVEEGRPQHQRRRGDETIDECEHQPEEEIPLRQQARIEERLLRRQAVHVEHVKTQHRQTGFGADLPGFEPVELAAAVEHELQRSDAQRQAQETEPVEPAPRIALRFRQEGRRAGQRQQTERNIDVENIAPAQVLGDVAAERGPDE